MQKALTKADNPSFRLVPKTATSALPLDNFCIYLLEDSYLLRQVEKGWMDRNFLLSLEFVILIFRANL